MSGTRLSKRCSKRCCETAKRSDACCCHQAKEDGWQVELVSPQNYPEHCHIFTKSLIDVQQSTTPVLIPEGDLLKVQDTLFTNINLRRLNIGARGALSINDARWARITRSLVRAEATP